MYMIGTVLVVLPFFFALWLCLKLISWFFEAYVTSVGSSDEVKMVSGSVSLAAKAGIFVSVLRGKRSRQDDAPVTLPASPVSPELASLNQTLDALRVRKQIVETEREIAKIKQEIDAPQALPVAPQPLLVAAAATAVAAAAASTTVAVVDEGVEQQETITVRDPVTGELVVV